MEEIGLFVFVLMWLSTDKFIPCASIFSSFFWHFLCHFYIFPPYMQCVTFYLMANVTTTKITSSRCCSLANNNSLSFHLLSNAIHLSASSYTFCLCTFSSLFNSFILIKTSSFSGMFILGVDLQFNALSNYLLCFGKRRRIKMMMMIMMKVDVQLKAKQR